MKHILLLITICFLLSCSEDNVYTKTGMVEIEKERSIPDTVIFNEQVQFKIKASATNLCWSDLFVELKEMEEFEYSLKAYGTFTCRERGCICADAMLYMDTVINFQPPHIGTYIFNIQETRNRIVIDKLTVK